MPFLRSRQRSAESQPQSSELKPPTDLSTPPLRTPADAEKGNGMATARQDAQQTVNASSAGFAFDNVLVTRRTEDVEPEAEDDDDEEEDRTRNGRAKGTTRTRFEAPPPFFSKEAIRAAWDAVWCQLRNPSHPSTTSQSALEGGTDNGYGDSVSFKRPGGGSQARSASGYEPNDEDSGPGSTPEPVHHVVVDSDLGQYIPPSKSDNGSAVTPGNGTGLPTTTDGSYNIGGSRAHDGTTGDASSIRRDRRASWIRRTWMWEVCVERCWPAVVYFCESKFPEAAKEKSYQKEFWFAWRPAAIIASLFYVIAWILTSALLPRPFNAYQWYGYFGITGFFILPLPILVIFDFARYRPLLYQIWLFCATWVYSVIVIVDMHNCGFYTNHRNCGSKDFLGLFYWGIGLPVLAVLALGQKRHFHIAGMLLWIILVSVLILQGGSPALMYRNLVNFILFHIFILLTSYLKEKSDRQMFALRTQLKLQYRATQAAQVAERKASDSKKRFVSYIFHEVRVPLNTAVLAIQNLEGEGIFESCNSDQKDLVNGLTGSLSMMEKVLNDVLSFNRMESGKFSQARKPFDFHQSVQLVLLSHRSQAMSAGLALNADLDPEIDKLGGTFIGDEMRLRQVMSNLVSNACKFCPSGSVKIVTKLLFPRTDSTGNTPVASPTEEKPDELGHGVKQFGDAPHCSPGSALGAPPESSMSTDTDQTLTNMSDSHPVPVTVERIRQLRDARESASSTRPNFGVRIPKKPAETKAIIRVEVHDTGVGLHKRDVIDNRLFSPYVQTEIGRRQGGKGSGLGLALCMQIIRLCGGRLGVDSQVGEGSCFWFEIALLLPPPTTGDWVRPAHAHSPPPRRASLMESIPPVIASDKFYDGDGQHLSLPAELRPHPMQHASDASSVLAPELEMDTMNRQLATSVHELQARGHIPSGIPAEGAIEMIELGLSPASLVAIDLRGPSTERGDVSPVVNKENSPQVAAAVSAESSTLSPAQKRGGSSAFAEHADPVQALVVDDDPLTRKLMARMLQRLGHRVTTAENGAVALQMMAERHQPGQWGEQFHIVFLDNQMPKMTGIECARELRRMGCSIFIVGATGNALKEDQEEYNDAGADQVLTKPVKEASMRQMIEEARKRVAGETQPRRIITTRLSEPRV